MVTAEGYCCCLWVSFCSVSGNFLYTGWPPTHKEGCAADNGPLSKRAKSSLRHIRTSKTHLKLMSRILQWNSICVLCSLPFSLGNILSGKKPQRCHLKVKVWILKITFELKMPKNKLFLKSKKEKWYMFRFGTVWEYGNLFKPVYKKIFAFVFAIFWKVVRIARSKLAILRILRFKKVAKKKLNVNLEFQSCKKQSPHCKI